MTTIVYTKPDCPQCTVAKHKLTRIGEPFTEIVVGKDITREEFIATFPQVRTMPHIVYTK